MARAEFAEFDASERPQDKLRAEITRAYRLAEPDCVARLIDLAKLPDEASKQASALTRYLVVQLRRKTRSSGIEGLMHEYSLSSQEGVALMCLAEALLRIPDAATRDALIRDKIAAGDWRAHVGNSPSPFVNAATWGLLVTRNLTGPANEGSLSSALTRLIGRGGEPLIRHGVNLAMRLMGQQFVTGQTIEEALSNSRTMEARGFRYSYDMLGEGATSAEDAARYLLLYEMAIHAIGKSSRGRGIYEGPGISIKLSAIHPRYSRSKIARVKAELSPRLKQLALLAKHYQIGFNIDAEEADRLDLSLDLFESLCFDDDLSGWSGLGFVVQAYQKRCAFVVDWIVDLARRSGRRLMVRLVKGAYWDSEIKRTQVDGMKDFPVFTRKVHTDVSYLACARKLLAAPDAVFPQFATHNARTLASIIQIAGPSFYRGQYEFQCLHGMGEPLYEEVVGINKLDRPCRIYAPVGSHETLLAYLVRRLLENGANTSFVNRIADSNVPVEDLIADPVSEAQAIAPLGASHNGIAKPRDLYGRDRANSMGIDISDERELLLLGEALAKSAKLEWKATTFGATGLGETRLIRNPADKRDVVGHVRDSASSDVGASLMRAVDATRSWSSTNGVERAAQLNAAADQLEARTSILVGLIVREAGKSYANAIAEVREAVDFLRYYASEIRRLVAAENVSALGPIVCISPWNFPLAIFVGQVAAALAAGNPVLAKPAEETPLIAAEAVRLLHEAGIPNDVLQLLPGDGEVGAALVADPRIQGVMFTGSTTVARLIQKQLAGRLSADGRRPIPLIAETGGQNALVVDSSALAEQVVADVVASAFDSAGQRCSSLRILCLQEEVADRVLAMLRGAMRELEIGNPSRLSVDVGPVISEEARENVRSHVKTMRRRGHTVEELALPCGTEHGTFVCPTIIEISKVSEVEREVFGPVLHVMRYRRDELDSLINQINASGYALTCGLHSRIDDTIAKVVNKVVAGNIYINRNIIGAVVGVQPFGGTRLSGTGPKAGGPLYLGRLIASPRKSKPLDHASVPSNAALAYLHWCRAERRLDEMRCFEAQLARSLFGAQSLLPGAVGESNRYCLGHRGPIAALARDERGLLIQIGAIFATGNLAIVEADNPVRAVLATLPGEAKKHVWFVEQWWKADGLEAVLFEGKAKELVAVNSKLAQRSDKIVEVIVRTSSDGDYDLDRLVKETSISTNTTAAGGNASLMSMG
ncbi:trifunctional transcriptional regulator/proline dehydrogenase/L-glutamate gamma-semialdehyde dehydrogenase [Bradyrhizobium sp. BWA-3-5]|nr:trifunctional transcriptional regulator/proline dehydrogenase/L-glutamate gamma-semialdehyde dehydrogenase [Bradyrhizobium sp. BWA-3-5]WOH69917.1 trifunctional transcriptional regulator/proline dehydrogenase/L-glutamate gamma-semialdehyde dehydrogenase [Bradyrhizobium sp. BWA-3-5]